MSSIRFALSERVGAHHFALYRAWINGIDLSEAGLRYIDERDPRKVRSVVEGLRIRFIQAAHRANLPRYARLLSTRLKTSAQDPRGEPQQRETSPGKESLDLQAFAEEIDPEGFYSESELIKLYEERVRPTADGDTLARQRRRARWIAQQEEALFWIERFLVSRPLPEDPLPAWFEGSAVQRLQRSGVATLANLKAFIERHGKTWYAHIDGVGSTTAERIVQWLQEHAGELGELSDTAIAGRLQVARAGLPSVAQRIVGQRDAQTKPTQGSGALAPLGRDETYAPAPASCLIRASDDLQAMQAWIEARAGSPHTARVYRREAERFLLFLAQEKSIDLHSLKVQDINDYKTFLALLGRVDAKGWPFRVPQEQYCAPRNIPRADPRWRPFEGPLSAKSAQYALVVVGAFLEFLTDVRYLAANPIAGVNIKLAGQDMRSPVKGLSRGQFDLVREHVMQLPDDHAGARARFLLELAYSSAARLSELAQTSFADLSLVRREDEAGHYVMLALHGKGGKIRNVYLGEAVLRAWREYAQHRGLNTVMTALKGQALPMLATLDDGAPIGAAMIYRIVKEIFEGASRLAAQRGLYDDAAEIAACSPHDLRHCRARHLGQGKVALAVLQRMLGHASPATTSIYVTNSDLEMAQALANAE